MEDSVFDKMPELERLLETKPFSALTTREKEEVLRHMRQQEYDAYHETIVAGRNRFSRELETLTPDPAMLDRLLEKMEKKSTGRKDFLSVLQKLMTSRVPVYQPAFVIAVIAILTALFFTLNSRNHEIVRYLARTDTVYLEKQAPVLPSQLNQTVQQVEATAAADKKTPSKERFPPATENEVRKQAPPDQYLENAYQKIRFLALTQRRHTASDDSALIRFLVAAN